MLTQTGCNIVPTTLDGDLFLLNSNASSVYQLGWDCGFDVHGELTVSTFASRISPEVEWSVQTYEPQGTEWHPGFSANHIDNPGVFDPHVDHQSGC